MRFWDPPIDNFFELLELRNTGRLHVAGRYGKLRLLFSRNEILDLSNPMLRCWTTCLPRRRCVLEMRYQSQPMARYWDLPIGESLYSWRPRAEFGLVFSWQEACLWRKILGSTNPVMWWHYLQLASRIEALNLVLPSEYASSLVLDIPCSLKNFTLSHAILPTQDSQYSAVIHGIMSQDEEDLCDARMKNILHHHYVVKNMPLLRPKGKEEREGLKGFMEAHHGFIKSYVFPPLRRFSISS